MSEREKDIFCLVQGIASLGRTGAYSAFNVAAGSRPTGAPSTPTLGVLAPDRGLYYLRASNETSYEIGGMAYSLEQMAKDIRAELSARSAADCSDALCRIVSRALTDDDFVAKYLPDRAEGEHPREVLHEDPDLGFCICGHVYEGAAESAPHDHGSSWAIYGQAEGVTEMTDWKIVAAGAGDNPSRVVPERTHELTRGDAHFYDVGAVHSRMTTCGNTWRR